MMGRHNRQKRRYQRQTQRSKAARAARKAARWARMHPLTGHRSHIAWRKNRNGHFIYRKRVGKE